MGGKRVKPGWLAMYWRPGLVAVGVLAVVVLLLGAVYWPRGYPVAPAAAPTPAPQPTWTTYVDQMPEACFAMLDAGSEFFDTQIEINNLIIEARALDEAGREARDPKKLEQAAKLYDKAKRLSQRNSRASRIFAQQYNKCLEA